MTRIAQKQGTSQGQPIFTEASLPFSDGIPNTSPLNSFQELVFGFAVDDNARAEYLKENFPGQQISIDPERGFMLGNTPVNPKGLDKGDFLRNAGFVLPIGGQMIAGGMAAQAAAPAGPLAALGAGMAAGSLGAVAGESVRQQVGTGLGVGGTGGDKLKAAGKEAALAAGGELVGFGIGRVGGKVLSEASPYFEKVAKPISQWWGNFFKNSPSLGPEMAKFIGGIEKKYGEGAKYHGYAETFKPENADPRATAKTVLNTIFGSKALGVEQLNSASSAHGGAKLGAVHIVKSIKEVDDNLFDEFIATLGGPDQEIAKIIRATPEAQLFNAASKKTIATKMPPQFWSKPHDRFH
jgi:hypothetical protein